MVEYFALAVTTLLTLPSGSTASDSPQLQALVLPGATAPGTVLELFLEGAPLDCAGFSASAAFAGNPTNYGYYAASGTAISTIADFQTLAPDSASNFEAFSLASCDERSFVFAATNESAPSQRALFISTGSAPLERIIGFGDLIDGDPVLSVSGSSVRGEALAFNASLPARPEVIVHLAETDAEPTIVVTDGDPVPGSSEVFEGLDTPVLVANQVVFRGFFFPLQRGLYSWTPGGPPEEIVRTGDSVPGAPGETFADLGSFDAYRNGLAFLAAYGSGAAIFYWDGQVIQRVIGTGDTTTHGTITAIGPLAANGSTLAFAAVLDGGAPTLYSQRDGDLHRILGLGDTLDAGTVTSFRFDASRNSVAVTAVFSDNARALYRLSFAPTALEVPLGWWTRWPFVLLLLFSSFWRLRSS